MRDVMSNTAFSIYLSYPIDRDNKEIFYSLLQKSINTGTEIFAYLLDWEKMECVDENTPFPKFRLYVPAEHEVFIHSAYKSGFLTKEQINCINYKIIEKCDLLILFNGCGLDVDGEIAHARREKIPVYSMPDLSPHAIQALRLTIKLIIKSED